MVTHKLGRAIPSQRFDVRHIGTVLAEVSSIVRHLVEKDAVWSVSCRPVGIDVDLASESRRSPIPITSAHVAHKGDMTIRSRPQLRETHLVL